MEAAKRKRLEKAGWRVGTVREFLGLSEQESKLIEVKLALGKGLRQVRTQYGLSQQRLADLIHSSQSRVAKMEGGDQSVSIDLMFRAFVALGAGPKQIGRSLGKVS